MNTERWTEARALFDQAAALPEVERAAFVETSTAHDPELRAELLSLLGALADAGGFLAGTHVGALAAATEPETAEIARERIGPWRIAGTLGRGGMGVVYLGERATGDFDQRAAIKVVSGGAENAAIVRRFQIERRILAALEHPAIARLLDGGTTDDGLPYFVMEYVEGETLLAFADARGLDLRARIELFLEVCAAVEHAHQRLVLHRDLKPSNILVGADGRPKLLDFGIGKLLTAEEGTERDATSTLERWMTPSYASPEQIAGGPTTTATDVHGLGVVLFELLTGARPFRQRAFAARELAMAAEEPPRRASTASGERNEASPRRDEPDATLEPGERARRRSTTPARLRRQLAGDLDNVLGKALAPDPGWRYSAVADLANDLRRYLRGETVLARPASRSYRFAKFVRRHRVAVAAGSAIVALVAVLTAVYGWRLRQERDLARRESERARAVTGFLSQLLAGADPNKTRGATLTLREFLAEAPPKIVAAIADPRVRAEVLHVVGEADWHAGAQREAIVPLTQALELRERELGRDHADTGRTMTVLGAAKGAIGETKEGQLLLRRGIQILETSLGENAPDLVWPLDRLAVLVFEEDLHEAERLAKRALRIHFVAGTPLSDRAFLLQHLAVFARGLGDNKRGAALYLRSYEVGAATLGPESPIANTALCNAARAFNEIGESRRALGLQQKAQASLEKAWHGDNMQLAGCLRAGAETLVQLDRLDEARALAEQAYAMDRRLYGDDHMQTMNMLATIAYVADAQGRFDEAAELNTRFLDFQKTQGAAEDAGWSIAYLSQARRKLAHGDRDGAEAQARSAFALQQKELAPDEPVLVPTLVFLGELAEARGDLVEARKLLDQAATIAHAKLTPEQRDYRLAEAALARLGARPSR